MGAGSKIDQKDTLENVDESEIVRTAFTRRLVVMRQL
jgi:hypothetical protein